MKTAFITGATAGFGQAAARRFIQEGWRVIGTGRREHRLKQLACELGDNFYPLCFDISNKSAVDKALQSLPPACANIDLLINNAGLALGMSSFEHTSTADWEVMVDTNIKGLLYITHGLLPHMLSQGHGHIINLGSTAGTYPYPGANVYGSTKAFVNMFSLELRADLHGKNIRVSCIEPGYCETEFGVVRFQGDQDKADTFYQGMAPLTAEDIAETLYWCAAQPAHVNVNKIELMPTRQSFSGFKVQRD